ncbi:MAG: UDP-N-acetylmuramoyl-tripeptide--D-alanyl-D-alanine ligase [Clostridia bacterium]|nr:UDP-N-acetylmuramoyl-tripeptide--D-alanyl-D-alanine ligase [Clostridia bacterium]
MQKISCQEIVKATNGVLVSGSINAEFTGISIDSRKISSGDLFIPIVGERFDGHDFIQSSLELGAEAVLTHKTIEKIENKIVIKVDDTSKALRDIAEYYRTKFDIPFVGITGSVGKTSTKDMIASVLEQEFNVLKTQGNFNNEIGLPLTVFNLESSHEAAVIEMGMSGFGEISRLTSIVRPSIAVITNIGLSHIEKLGSRQNILKAKMEIFEGLRKDGLAVLNGDDKLLYGLKDLLKFRTVFYGMEEDVDYQAYNITPVGESGTYFEITIGSREYKVHVPVPGIHNVYNALAAIAAGIELKISMGKIVKGISQFSSGKMRQNIISHKGFKIINDAYNASPQSMEAAISVLKDIAGNNRTIAVLGDMLEMGEWAYKAHIDVGKFAATKGIDYLITIGENGKNIAIGAQKAGVPEGNIHTFEDNNAANAFLKGLVKENDYILVKGSRGMRMEQIVESLTNEL